MPRYLIDTHILIWWLEGSDRLPHNLQDILRSGANAIFLSAGAVWEIAIKRSLGRLDVPDDLETILGEESIDVLPITAAHALAVADLPRHHGDPFDRIQVAQARIEGMTLISCDGWIARYDVAAVSS